MKNFFLLSALLLGFAWPAAAQTEVKATSTETEMEQIEEEIVANKLRVDFTLRIGCYFADGTFGPTPYSMTKGGDYRNNYSVSAGFEVDFYLWKQLFAGIAPEVMHASGVYERKTNTGEFSRKTKRTSLILPVVVGYDWALTEKIHLLPATGVGFNYVFSGSDAYRDSYNQEKINKLKDLKNIDRCGWNWMFNLDAQFDEVMIGLQYALGLDESAPNYLVARIGWRF